MLQYIDQFTKPGIAILLIFISSHASQKVFYNVFAARKVINLPTQLLVIIVETRFTYSCR